MKIAFETQFPADDAVRSLIGSATALPEDCATVAAWQRACGKNAAIAAYDQGKLVGLGAVESDGSIRIVVADSHRHRAITGPMTKLLSVRKAPAACAN